MKVRRLTYAGNGTNSATFYYDGKNRQIARNINGVIRFNSWDGWDLLEEYSSSLNVATGYLQGTTGVVKSWSAANTLYYYQDKLGSTTHVANASGQLVESYKYDLYGTPSYFNSTSQPLNSSTVGVADLYAGERWIPELALYDLRNRFMSPELGRFLQTDPIGFQGDASNLYRYCGNDPVDKSDPMGLTAATGSTIAERMSLFYGDSGQGSSLYELDHPTLSLTMATVPRNDEKSQGGVRHGDGYGSSPVEAGLQREGDAKKIGRGDTEGVTEIGQDTTNPRQFYSPPAHGGNKEVSNFTDDVKKDKAPVAVSYVDPARLPNNYKLVGGVVGYRLFSPGRAREDIQRAKNAGWRTFIMTAPERKVPVIYDKYTSPNPVF